MAKKDSGEGVFVAYLIILCIAVVIGSIAIITSSLIAPLFSFWQMRAPKRHIGAIIGLIGFFYFLFDLHKEWISSFLFYGWNSDGEFTEGLLGEDKLVYFWSINFAGLGINIFLIVQYFLKYKNLKAQE